MFLTSIEDFDDQKIGARNINLRKNIINLKKNVFSSKKNQKIYH